MVPKILSKIREHSETLVNQSLMVSDELIRVAILWHEQWYEALEEASRLYFGEHWQYTVFIIELYVFIWENNNILK